jgi:hypothetical protein
MEVHHHPEVEKKSFKEYLLEGLMIFLAVTMGFIAENIREHFVETKKEKEYIVSMLKELRSDSAQLAEVLKDSVRIKKIDSLSTLLLSHSDSQQTIKSVYLLAGSICQYVSMEFSRNTLTQLKNGGNMRLIKNPDIVDSLNKLDNIITSLYTQLEGYQKFTNDNIRELYSILDYSFFVKNGKHLEFSEVLNNSICTYLTNDKKKLIEFGGKIGFQGGVLMNYFELLKNYSYYSNNLMSLLQKEYHLKKE